MAWLNLVYKFLRLGPLALGAIAIAILGLGYYLQIGQNERNAFKVAALEAGPPATVVIEKFDRNQHMTELREVVVQAQPVLEFAYRLTLTKDSGDDHVFMVPLVASSANRETEVVGIAYYTSETEDFANITPELLSTGWVGFGNVGPLTNYNGKISGMGQWDDLTKEAFFDEGLDMPSNPVIVWPYMEGRAVALAPPKAGDMTVFGLLSKIAGVIGLLALGKLVISSGRDEKPALSDTVDATPAPVFDSVPQASGVPLWKQRSGLAHTPEMNDYNSEPAQFEPAQFDTETDPQKAEYEPLTMPQRSRFGLRKALIGIVGVAFVVMLVSVLSGLLAETRANDQLAAVQTIEERVAFTAADVVVPEADPNRHWTDIDVTPIAEWFVAKFFLAVAGDTDAQLVLGLIVGGVFGSMFMLRWFFMMRGALRPKTTARFDSMGIN